MWLPARDLKLSEQWSNDDKRIKAGEPLTRHILVSALGQLDTQIPAIEPPAAAGIHVYPDKPDLSRQVESGGIRGVRKDQYALIGVTPGKVILPALELPWWHVDSGEWRIATLPERSIEILPSAETPPSEPETAAPVVADALGPDVSAGSRGGFWRRVSEFLAALWLLTLFGWWWSSRPKREPREPRPVPIHKRQARLLKAARKAALAGDAAAVRAALLDWGRLQWPDDAPRSVGVLATRISAPLADELVALSSFSYGSARSDWNGEALAKALRSFAVLGDEETADEEVLPPLMPST